MDVCHFKNAEFEVKHQKYKSRVVLRGDIVKDDSGSNAVSTEQGSSASQMTAAKVMDIISRLPGCAGQAADAVSAYTKVKPRCSKITENSQNRNAPDIWIRLPRHKLQNHGPVWKTQSFLLSEICTVILWQDFMGNAMWENPIEVQLGEGFQLGMLIRTPWKKGLFLSVYVDDIKFAGKKQNIDPMWKVLKEVDLGEPTSFLDPCIPGMYSNTMWNKQRYCWQITEPCLNHEFPQGELKN